jgi:hypothetical protein
VKKITGERRRRRLFCLGKGGGLWIRITFFETTVPLWIFNIKIFFCFGFKKIF